MPRALTDEEIVRLRQLAQDLRTSTPDIAPGQFDGRGIVVCAGGASVFTNAYVLVHLLRNTLGCRLPIEVWHLGAGEMSASMAALLEELDVSVIDAEPIIAAHGAGIRDGWQLKPFAMLWSRFAEVLLLDADQVPVRDPAECFEWLEYHATGTVFWPDIVRLRASNPIWAALGLPPRTTISMESGQVLVDKRRCLRALAATVRLNEAADVLYQVIYGDKDTFLLGWELVASSFAMVPHLPFGDERVLTQRDFAGHPMFQHRTGGKWLYGGEQLRTENFAHMDACLAALAVLGSRWSGRVFHLPDRSGAARQVEAEVIAGGPLRLEIGQDEQLEVVLRPFGEIGDGRALDRQNWWCEEDGDGIVLNLARPEGVTYRFTRMGAGYWTGQRLRPPVVPAHLTTISEPAAQRAAQPGLVDELVRAARLGRPDADEDRLREALILLARVEPGTIARLHQLAAEGPPETRPVLKRILDVVAKSNAGPSPSVNRDSRILRTGYAPATGDGD